MSKRDIKKDINSRLEVIRLHLVDVNVKDNKVELKKILEQLESVTEQAQQLAIKTIMMGK